MDLSQIKISPRLRTSWEAIDLGFMMARSWYRPLFLSWFIPSAILFSLLTLLMPSDWQGYTIFFVWWLKPLWDKAPLYIASQSLFSEPVSVKQVLRSCLSLYKLDWLQWLTIRRFSPTRSLDMPITVLEKLQGEVRQKRLRVLHPTVSNGATWLTIVCIHIEYLLVFAAIGFFLLLIPNELPLDVDWFGLLLGDFLENSWLVFINNLLTLLAIALVAPFYTMAGFALYISRRVELEGWDIEIRFRQLANQKKKPKGSSLVLQTLLVISCFFFQSVDQTAYADDVQIESELDMDSIVVDEEFSAQESEKIIDAILAGEDFHQLKEESGWRFKDTDNEEDPSIPEWYIRFIEWLESRSGSWEGFQQFAVFGASAVEIILWLVVLTLLGLLVYYYRDALKSFIAQEGVDETSAPEPPEVLFGLDVREESVTNTITDDVLALWSDGQYREALGLLYGATLSKLIHQYHYEFLDGDTEQECANKVSQSAEPLLTGFMNELTEVWQQLAYAHRLPEQSQVIKFSNQWADIFSHGESDEK